MVVCSPTIYYSLLQPPWNTVDLNLEDHIDFWYKNINLCYQNNVSIDMICTYLEAINDEDIE